MSDNPSFLGRGWAAMVEHDKDIGPSLLILLSTAPGERVMRPTFGCGIKRHVFDSVAYDTVSVMKHLIERAALFFEPRITLKDIVIDDSDIDNSRLDIHLIYTICLTNTRSNMVYPFYFLEGTNVAP